MEDDKNGNTTEKCVPDTKAKYSLSISSLGVISTDSTFSSSEILAGSSSGISTEDSKNHLDSSTADLVPHSSDLNAI